MSYISSSTDGSLEEKSIERRRFNYSLLLDRQCDEYF